MKNCPELNIVKRAQTCKYLGYCSQILYSSTIPFNRFSIFTKWCHKLNFPILFTNLFTHGSYVMGDVKLCWWRRQGFNKGTLELKKDMVWKEQWMNLCDRGYFARASLQLLDPWRRPFESIEEWCHFDHGIIDRAVNRVNQWQKRLWRCICEKGEHFQLQL